MKKFVRGAKGQFKGSRPANPKAPQPRFRAPSGSPQTRECLADDPGRIDAVATTWRADERAHGRVVPQRAIASAPSLREARTVLGPAHSHVEAVVTIHVDRRGVQERMLAAGYPCAIPQATPGGIDPTSPEVAQLPATLAGKGVWGIEDHPTIPNATVVRSPSVKNSDTGWRHIEDGLRLARGPRLFPPRITLMAAAYSPVQAPPPPPEGYVPIRGIRSLMYSR